MLQLLILTAYGRFLESHTSGDGATRRCNTHRLRRSAAYFANGCGSICTGSIALATLGAPFALGFCMVCAWLVWRARPWQETDAMRQMAWLVLAVMGLHSLLEYPLWYGPFQIATLVCVVSLCRTQGARPASLRKQLVRQRKPVDRS
jgi:hypothetical protein